MYVAEEKTVVFGDNTYLIKALPALYGLNVLNRLKLMGDTPDSAFIKELLFKSVTCNNMQPTEDWFNRNFSRNYDELFQIFEAIIDFNFGDGDEEESH